MAERQYNTYTDEYRREAVDYVLSSGRPITQCAKELGLNSKTLNDWVLKFQRAGQQGDAGEDAARDDARRLREAERRIRQLEEENEFLKKAAAFFARSQA